MQNVKKLAQLEIPKSRGELYNDENIAKSHKLEKSKIEEIFRNLKNQKFGFKGMLL